MICPKCGNELRKVKNRGVEVDYCDNCQGVWFDFTEIEDLAAGIKEFNLVAPRLEHLRVAETAETLKHCPRCNSKMLKVMMRDEPPVFDCCNNDCGYWFDKDEFEEYVRNNKL